MENDNDINIINARDAISTFDAAAYILAVTELITDLIPRSDNPEAHLQPPLPPNDSDQNTISTALEMSKAVLEGISIPLICIEMSRSRGDCLALLDSAVNKLGPSPNGPTLQLSSTDMSAYNDKVKRLSLAVTRQVRSILRWVSWFPHLLLLLLLLLLQIRKKVTNIPCFM